MNLVQRPTFILLVGVFLTPVAHAIGDSGGCTYFPRTRLGAEVQNGSRQDVEREMVAWVDGRRKREHVPVSREQQILNLIQGTHGGDNVCQPPSLLKLAIHAGNVEVTKFLLDKPLGVTPMVTEDVLFDCQYDIFMSEAQRKGRLLAYSALFDRKAADVNATRAGRPLVDECKEPELVALLLERGARTDISVERGPGVQVNLLEAAIIDAVSTQEGGYTAKRLHGVERARLFSRVVTDSIVGRPEEKRIRNYCNYSFSVGFNSATCRELATFIKASPGTFGEAKKAP